MDDEPTGDAEEGVAAAPGDEGDLAPTASGGAVSGTEAIDDAAANEDETAEDETDEDLGELGEDPLAGRRNALPRRVESWRTRSASGAIATALAMGLQQVFEPEKRRPAAVAEAPSDPYSDDDPITVDYVPDDAEGTIVHVKPWLLQKDEPT